MWRHDHFWRHPRDRGIKYGVPRIPLKTRLIRLTAPSILGLLVLLTLLPSAGKAKGTTVLNQQLMRAARSGDLAQARTLVDKGAAVNAFDILGATPLFWAAQAGHTAVVKFLLKKGADVNARHGRAPTPLMGAAHNGNEELVRILLQEGADVNVTTHDGWSALSNAAFRDHKPVVRLLRERGAELTLTDAAMTGDVNETRRLIGTGADLNARFGVGERTPLIRAAKRGHVGVVRVLLANGADVNAKDEDGFTALIEAALQGNLDVAKLLVDKGSDLTGFSDENHWTPLMSAAAQGHLDVVRLLVEMGSDVNAVDTRGNTPLVLAAANGNLDVVKFLREKGATAVDGALIAAVDGTDGNHLAVIKWLVHQGADVNATDERGRTVLSIAHQTGRADIVQYLKGRGAK